MLFYLSFQYVSTGNLSLDYNVNHYPNITTFPFTILVLLTNLTHTLEHFMFIQGYFAVYQTRILVKIYIFLSLGIFEKCNTDFIFKFFIGYMFQIKMILHYHYKFI